MESSNATPKELTKKRIRRSSIMKIPNNEGNFVNKENFNPLNVKKVTHKTRDKDFTDGRVRNPFDIPQNMRSFSSRKTPGKPKAVPFIMSEPNTICDLDETFYKIIEGRPLRQITDVKVYMRNIRDITLNKANAAYLKDQMIQIDTNIAAERKEYDKTKNLYEKSVSNYLQFAKQSYNEVKNILTDAEKKTLELVNATTELEAYSFQYVKLRNQLFTLSYNFENLNIYAKFFYSISPIQWKEEDCKKDNLVIWNETSNTISSTSTTSMDRYKNIVYNFSGKPRIYFKRPNQLMTIYGQLGRQCLNYMQIDVYMKRILKSVLAQRGVLKEAMKLAIDEMKDFIDIYERSITFNEEKADDYKKSFHKILMSEFQALYASYDSSKLFTCVQYVNCRVFGNPEDPKDSIVTLMAHLERLYVEITSDLDNLDQKIVKAATNDFFTGDIKMMDRAFKAQRAIKECNILEKALFASVEPSRKKRTSKK